MWILYAGGLATAAGPKIAEATIDGITWDLHKFSRIDGVFWDFLTFIT
jgi:hypothetical protein